MQRTIKQWCIARHLNWYGQGLIGEYQYDWAVVLGEGRKAIFSSINTGKVPRSYPLRNRQVVIFPNINSSSTGGKLSEERFDRIIAWAEACLAGRITSLDEARP